MPDHFSLLDEPRSPWLDPEALKEKFTRLTSEHHPDRFHGGSDAEKVAAQTCFTNLNAAYTCLRDTKSRLQHLIELETGAKPSDLQASPPAMIELFFEVAQVCREADQFIAQKEKVTSPLLKVQLMEQTSQWRDRMAEVQSRLAPMISAVQTQIEALAIVWATAPPIGTPERRQVLPLEKLEEVYRLWAFISRWNTQIQERLFKLTL